MISSFEFGSVVGLKVFFFVFFFMKFGFLVLVMLKFSVDYTLFVLVIDKYARQCYRSYIN